MLEKLSLKRMIFDKFLPDNDSIRNFEKLFRNQNILIDNVNYKAAIQSVNTNIALKPTSQTILADAALGSLNITLPNPLNSITSDNMSLSITIIKTDTTSNIVNILPYSAELIAGSNSESLLMQEEILTFITDGINWHIGG